MSDCCRSTDVRLLSLWFAASLALCGIGGCGAAPVETYTVNSADKWDVVSSNGSAGYISFSQDNTGVSFTGYDTGGAALANFTGISPRFLKYPIQAGDTWSASGPSTGYPPGVSSVTVVTSNGVQVTVPAGTFTCVETTETTSSPQGYNEGVYISEYKRYFAPGVGLVKVVNTYKSGEVAIGELQSYTVPNADPNDYFPLNVNSSWTFRWVL